MEFEFDESKSAANAAKHGIDFIAAEELWLDELLIEMPAKTVDEPRALVIGVISGASTTRRSSRAAKAAPGSSR